MNNAEFARTDQKFRDCCQAYAAIDFPEKKELWEKFATRRQASKFRRKSGIVYRTTNISRFLEEVR